MNSSEFYRFRRPYDRVLRQLMLELEFFIEDLVGINIYTLTSRLKTYQSAIEKSKRLNLKIHEMHDIAGIRVVVSTIDEVDVIARFFSRKSDSKDLIIESDKTIERANGYRARHLVLEFSGHYSRSMYPTCVEVQVLTLLQSTFNYISRAWIYKANLELSKEWLSDFQRISNELHDIDQRINQLQQQVIQSSLSSKPDDPITPFSCQKIVNDTLGETIQLRDSVDLVRMLIDVGCDTNGKLQNFLKRKDIMAMREQIINMDAESVKALVNFVAKMPIYSFYTLFGLRYESTKELIQSLDELK
ncbi:hypothetical protein RIF25_16250 [Thermosynechococcaceae cyanobacterium BACA0444]|uniref:RelA/SpoT domain-containing protein n=1 Tax=Pseudocalidococcus azoricus BACA0444 TaxID=2918990 RepID=A0AAE4FUC7_9CYAN|nr:hypothetical protein [Pseudocalidococcus azoricus]MDS3862351.1 hypothetical protein [Pseudocalidococcus azoricus BACA0444]